MAPVRNRSPIQFQSIKLSLNFVGYFFASTHIANWKIAKIESDSSKLAATKLDVHLIEASGQPLAEKPMQVRLPIDVDAWLRRLPDRSVWLRRVIVAAARKEMEN